MKRLNENNGKRFQRHVLFKYDTNTYTRYIAMWIIYVLVYLLLNCFKKVVYFVILNHTTSCLEKDNGVFFHITKSNVFMCNIRISPCIP
eukprot:UN08897